MLKNILLTFVGIALLSGCERMKLQETSSVRIHVPELSSSSYKSSEILTSMGNGVNLHPIPTGFAGTKPINCFAVMVSGPEADMQRNTCGRKDANDNLIPSSIRNVGRWAGGVAPGQDLVLNEVPSGKGRVVHMVGFHVTSPEVCKNFAANNFPDDDTTISDPYFLGTTSGLEFLPGQTTDPIKVVMSYDANNREAARFDDCKGPDFPAKISNGNGGGDNGGGTPMALTIEKNFFPVDAFGSETSLRSCQAAYITVLDGNAKQTSTANAVTADITVSDSALGVYATEAACLAASVPNQTASLTIAATKSNQMFYLRVPAYPAGGTVADFSVTNISSGLAFVSRAPFPVYQPTKKAIDIRGPARVIENVCYNYSLKQNKVWGSTGGEGNVTATLSIPTGVKVYADSAQCNANTVNTISNTANNLTFNSYSGDSTPMELYIRFSDTVNAYDLGIVSTSDADYVPQFRHIERDLSTSSQRLIPKYIFLDGHNTINYMGSGCYQTPYTLTVLNENHTVIPMPAAAQVDVSFPGSDPDYNINSAVGCAGTVLQPGTPLNFYAGDTKKEIYLNLKNPLHENVVLTPTVNLISGLTTAPAASSYTVHVTNYIQETPVNNFNISTYNSACANLTVTAMSHDIAGNPYGFNGSYNFNFNVSINASGASGVTYYYFNNFDCAHFGATAAGSGPSAALTTGGGPYKDFSILIVEPGGSTTRPYTVNVTVPGTSVTGVSAPTNVTSQIAPP